jgi:hypothetical protein
MRNHPMKDAAMQSVGFFCSRTFSIDHSKNSLLTRRLLSLPFQAAIVLVRFEGCSSGSGV